MNFRREEWIISNLVLNSIKSLKFVGREKPKIKVTINSNSKTKTLDLLFEDNGNGIPENNIDKIWTAFRSFYPKHGIKYSGQTRNHQHSPNSWD